MKPKFFMVLLYIKQKHILIVFWCSYCFLNIRYYAVCDSGNSLLPLTKELF